jgi:hypothetical protein
MTVPPKEGSDDMEKPTLLKNRSPSYAAGLAAFAPQDEEARGGRTSAPRFDPLKASLVCEACGRTLEPNSAWHFWADAVYCSTTCKSLRLNAAPTARRRRVTGL